MRVTKKIKVNTYNCSILFVVTNEMGKSEKYLQKKYFFSTTLEKPDFKDRLFDHLTIVNLSYFKIGS